MAVDVIGGHRTTVFHHAVQGRRLSRGARGLLVELLSQREGYGAALAMLLGAGVERRDALRTADARPLDVRAGEGERPVRARR
ncbi:hypothetical protein [Streptomyces sp. SGAir0957]